MLKLSGGDNEIPGGGGGKSLLFAWDFAVLL